MDHIAVLALYDRDMREGAQPDGPGARIERAGRVVRQVASAEGWNGVVWSDLDEASADAAIAEQIAHYSGLDREFEWKLYGHDLPVDLGKRLRTAGFAPEPEETLMIGEVADLTLDGDPPEGVRFLPVTDRAASISSRTCTRRRSAPTAPGCDTSCSPGSRTTRTPSSPSSPWPVTHR